ncbi:PREDICTED: uncharacterized protein LOC109160804 [Ipomoea nil]|uniref:uncharacterized protein LOC109160804 n=1 Tax=Ipomoea nil TaxID=35883 RepID=UPI000901CC7D|nr:PREDICTED: uncharacterized protein LOC109160804 [Ipomoea nil]
MCKARYVPWQFTFHFIAIYAKHTRADRSQLWTQLSDCIDDNRPLLLAGDFNVISSISEHRGNALPDVNCIFDFSNFITDNSLIDLATIGSLYTWHGIRNTGAVWKRLDRFLMNPPLRDYFTEVRINVLARTSSDHSPILQSGTNNTLSCPKQFRFQTMWTSHPDFINVVRLNWNQQADGGGMRALAFKIKRLKRCLRIWNRDTFGNVFDRIRVLESSVAEAENTFDDDPSPGSRESLHKLQADLLQALKQEEMFWKQKARVKWLKEGDSNTRFFHAVVKDRHQRQRISAIKSGTGELLTTQPAIQTEEVSFFSGLFSAEDCPGMEALLQCLPVGVLDSDKAALSLPVTREEVKEAVWKLDPDSAAGPDGFSGAFFRHCWDIIKDDLYMATLDFFAGVPVPRAMASAQIVLIPKKLNLDTFADYRPICLFTFVSKVFTRIIASRLSTILPKIISREQAGFLQAEAFKIMFYWLLNCYNI